MHGLQPHWASLLLEGQLHWLGTLIFLSQHLPPPHYLDAFALDFLLNSPQMHQKWQEQVHVLEKWTHHHLHISGPSRWYCMVHKLLLMNNSISGWCIHGIWVEKKWKEIPGFTEYKLAMSSLSPEATGSKIDSLPSAASFSCSNRYLDVWITTTVIL